MSLVQCLLEKDNVILIHIPKTAGTSVKHILMDNNIKFNELHLNARLECQPVRHIDYILNNNDVKVILTWRNPIKHTESSFYFYKEYAKFNCPKDIDQFIHSKNLQNQQSSFLFKNFLFDVVDFDDKKIDVIHKLIKRPNTFCFLQDYFEQSKAQMMTFLNKKNAIQNKKHSNRFNFNKPIVSHLSEYQIQNIHDVNKIDFFVYNIIKNKYNYNICKEGDILFSSIPWQYPMNHVSGIYSIQKYEHVLKKINSSICDGRQYNIEQYLNSWINMFINEIGAEIDITLNKENTIGERLNQLSTALNDDSEKISIPTRF